VDTIIKCGKCGKNVKAIEVHAYSVYKCSYCGALNEITNVSIKEWIGFNYAKFISDILEVIREDQFIDLLASNDFDLNRGKLNIDQINNLKKVLAKAFKNGQSIKKLVSEINSKVKVGDLKIYDKSQENVTRIISEAERNMIIARTETVRVSNIAVEKELKKSGFKKYYWIASWSDRTCPICEALDGKIFELGSQKPPAHPRCRCTISAVTELDEL